MRLHIVSRAPFPGLAERAERHGVPDITFTKTHSYD